jgi:hypothetical protein
MKLTDKILMGKIEAAKCDADAQATKDLENLRDHVLNGPTPAEREDLDRAIDRIVKENQRLSARQIAHDAMNEEACGSDAQRRFEIIYFTLSKPTDPNLDQD